MRNVGGGVVQVVKGTRPDAERWRRTGRSGWEEEAEEGERTKD